MRSRPRARSQRSAAASSAAAASGSSSHSKKPNRPQVLSWNSLKMRSTVAPGEEVLGLAVLEPGVLRAVEELAALGDERRHPVRLVTIELPGQLDEGREVAL
jgi:hypothetical protein